MIELIETVEPTLVLTQYCKTIKGLGHKIVLDDYDLDPRRDGHYSIPIF
jgi:c-di-GMP-related signal transduction protein